VRTAQSQALEILDDEAGNVATAVRCYLAHDTGPLPHLFRVLWPFWFSRDHMREGQAWVTQLLAADLLTAPARAELAWTALAAALDVGDDGAAMAASRRLEPLLPESRTRSCARYPSWPWRGTRRSASRGRGMRRFAVAVEACRPKCRRYRASRRDPAAAEIAGYSMGRRAMAGGSRPATSQLAPLATTGSTIAMATRCATGTLPSRSRSGQ
jgi:hypothetical protein